MNNVRKCYFLDFLKVLTRKKRSILRNIPKLSYDEYNESTVMEADSTKDDSRMNETLSTSSGKESDLTGELL